MGIDILFYSSGEGKSSVELISGDLNAEKEPAT